MKETFEWIQSWCDHADKNDLPRVLLVGDSITRAYQEKVRELLRGKYYVDYIATSYAVDQPIYVNLVTAFAKDSDYAAIHFNHGLHGLHMTDKVYGEGVEKLLADIGKGKKVILATSTLVKEKGNARIDYRQTGIVLRRNQVTEKIAARNGYATDDLYAVSANIPNEYRWEDGTHYDEKGSARLAESVARSIIRLGENKEKNEG